MDILNDQKSLLVKTTLVLVVILSLYFLTKTVSEIKNYKNMPMGSNAVNTMSFSGTGEVFAAPDLATINFTIRDSQKELKSAQDKVTAKEKSALAFLEAQNIDKKDIKTENYSSYPRYDYATPCYGGVGVPCRQDAPKVIGYEVSEYITVKVRDLTKAGDVVKGIGAIGVSEISGPNFTIENEEGLKEKARKIAIDDAKAKAKILTKDLNVRLVRVVNFSENGNYPMMYSSKGAEMMDGVSNPSSPELPTGENKITSNVTVTYEIR